jgi:hypothetical protein
METSLLAALRRSGAESCHVCRIRDAGTRQTHADDSQYLARVITVDDEADRLVYPTLTCRDVGLALLLPPHVSDMGFS